MIIIKIINKILIVLIILLVLSLIILSFISKEDNKKVPNKNIITTTQKIEEKEEEQNIITNDEVLEMLSIYKTDINEFIINDLKDNKYKVERKNTETKHIDMILEVDAITGTVSIIDIIPESNTVGGVGGKGNE